MIVGVCVLVFACASVCGELVFVCLFVCFLTLLPFLSFCSCLCSPSFFSLVVSCLPVRFVSPLSSSLCIGGKVQDSYSLRCVPQVHGVVHDTTQFVRGILETEINSATDNPMIFGSQSFTQSMCFFLSLFYLFSVLSVSINACN
jgi:Aromatic amino acid lyase